jgi:hypothetical protein
MTASRKGKQDRWYGSDVTRCDRGSNPITGRIMQNKIPYSNIIAKRVKEGIRNGVSIKDIIASVQSLQNAPCSTTTFYKLYGGDIAQTKADIIGQVGSKVVEQALDGDFKSQELFLRSKGGWSPTNTVQEREVGSDEEEDSSAVETLMGLLGKKVNNEAEDNG